MHDELDSGERRAQKLEVQFQKILSEIDSMPTKIELAIIKAINAHQVSCMDERKSKMPSSNPKLMKGLIGAIVALAGAIATLAALVG